MSSQDADTIRTTLKYNTRTEPGLRPYYFMREQNEEDARKFPGHHGKRGQGQLVDVQVNIASGRASSGSESSSSSHTGTIELDQKSFQLVRHDTSLATSDFYDLTVERKRRYYSEVKEVLANLMGTSHVKIMSHQVRNEARLTPKPSSSSSLPGSAKDDSSVKSYASCVHSDSGPMAAEQTFKNHVWRMDSCCTKGRFVLVNCWRNISDAHPIENNFLAFCDERSLVKPDDYMEYDVFGEGWSATQYRLSHRNARRHKWYYFPRMRKNEMAVFKVWDSDWTKESRCCFHTSVRDPRASPNAPPRESIEVRAICFFPSTEDDLNTCPPVTPCESEREEIVETFCFSPRHVAYFIEMNYRADSFSHWKEEHVEWARSLLEDRHETGVEEIAYQGLKWHRDNNHEIVWKLSVAGIGDEGIRGTVKEALRQRPELNALVRSNLERHLHKSVSGMNIVTRDDFSPERIAIFIEMHFNPDNIRNWPPHLVSQTRATLEKNPGPKGLEDLTYGSLVWYREKFRCRKTKIWELSAAGIGNEEIRDTVREAIRQHPELNALVRSYFGLSSTQSLGSSSSQNHQLQNQNQQQNDWILVREVPVPGNPSDPQLLDWIETVKAILPDTPVHVIIKDLQATRDVNVTLNNLLASA